ncbi:MAG: HD domain-containing protein [Lachnospiraceae bacterium]|nr:HD domain-containing protein [Lachnospiraceae bacterium]
MKYIVEYNEGDRFAGIYLCKTKNIQKSKAGKTYYSLILQDKTGIVDGKIWELNNAIENFEQGDFIQVDGSVTTFQSSKQININRVRVADEGAYDPKDYVPASKYSVDKMYEELIKLVDSIEEPHLKKVLNHFFKEDAAFVKEFKVHSAAKSVHHGFLSGLLQHTLFVTKLCDFYTRMYPLLDRDLLLTAAMLHDIGKVEELSEFPAVDYTDRGQMLGHIYIGAERINRVIDSIEGFPPLLATELIHCILSHHGELEYGSPKKPAIAEAMALNMADNTDAKLENITELIEKADPTTEWLGYQKFYDSYIRQSSGTAEKRK